MEGLLHHNIVGVGGGGHLGGGDGAGLKPDHSLQLHLHALYFLFVVEVIDFVPDCDLIISIEKVALCFDLEGTYSLRKYWDDAAAGDLGLTLLNELLPLDVGVVPDLEIVGVLEQSLGGTVLETVEGCYQFVPTFQIQGSKTLEVLLQVYRRGTASDSSGRLESKGKPVQTRGDHIVVELEDTLSFAHELVFIVDHLFTLARRRVFEAFLAF